MGAPASPTDRPGDPAGRAHPRTLLITNDFPPRPGGIESYLRDFLGTLDPARVSVLASTRAPAAEIAAHDAAAPYRVHRLPDRVLLPLPHVARAAAAIIAAEDVEAVWFGAAAPLGLLAPALRRAGARRVVATTHGHEVGWAMLPGARAALRRIGAAADAVTFISDYTRRRIAAAFGPAAALERLPSGVDADFFRPDPAAGAAIRARHGIPADAPVVACISRLVARKGQDRLIDALPALARRHPGVRLLIVGTGPRGAALRRRARRRGVADRVTFAGAVPYPELPAHYNAADVFAMPARTRFGGLDVEGLGIVYLEAQACGIPVVAGDSGGAPETIVAGVTGHAVPGRDAAAVAAAIGALLAEPAAAAAMGRAGRAHVLREWTWDRLGAQLRAILDGPPARR